MSTELINEQPVQQNSFTPSKVGDISSVDLEYKRLQIWNHSNKFLSFGNYFKDTKVKSPFSLRFEMPLSKTETLCLKITTSLRRCEGSCHPHRQTPYLWWIDYKNIAYEYKHRFCFECINLIQRYMLSQVE